MYDRNQMAGSRLIQIGLAICLLASLLTASPAACTCSHNDEAKTSAECHSHHEDAENLESSEIAISIDDSCICAVEQRSPFVASGSTNKEFKASDKLANAEPVLAEIEFAAITSRRESSSEFVNDVSYSTTLKSLLPSRAPPRL